MARCRRSPTDLVLQERLQITLPGTGEPLVERLLDYSTADGRLRISKVQCGRHLAIHELEQIARDGVIGELDGFYSAKKQKHYSGCLRWLPADTPVVGGRFAATLPCIKATWARMPSATP